MKAPGPFCKSHLTHVVLASVLFSLVWSSVIEASVTGVDCIASDPILERSSLSLREAVFLFLADLAARSVD